ncbi:hypothetical protein AWC38_SpisGene20895 [Stylophora pistillata]|uniref:RNA-directed DNA polymerase from mobile element jockey n=1 Tax=Stylophora pistillata TaxID=50429 RepID=A0A2B4REZ4_STYPI|nr:hypothetical protein AWC38_SpisGene20895 [Stylophora pistillata]
MLERSIRVHPKVCPWISVRLKELIRKRQQAFYSNRQGLAYRFYRNAVNKERKLRKGKYYACKVQDLKGINPRSWWKEVNKLSGAKSQNVNLLNALNLPDFENLSPSQIANGINEALLEPLRQFQPLDRESGVYPLPLEDNPEFLEVTPERVYGNLSHLNKHKAPGPDGLSNWCLKEYAELLYQPIADILNSSYKEQNLPSVWKHANVTPLPKIKALGTALEVLEVVEVDLLENDAIFDLRPEGPSRRAISVVA